MDDFHWSKTVCCSHETREDGEFPTSGLRNVSGLQLKLASALSWPSSTCLSASVRETDSQSDSWSIKGSLGSDHSPVFRSLFFSVVLTLFILALFFIKCFLSECHISWDYNAFSPLFCLRSILFDHPASLSLCAHPSFRRKEWKQQEGRWSQGKHYFFILNDVFLIYL